MTNFTGANVIDATEVAKYQTDIYSEVHHEDRYLVHGSSAVHHALRKSTVPGAHGARDYPERY